MPMEGVEIIEGGICPDHIHWYGIIKVELTNSPRRSRINERKGEEK